MKTENQTNHMAKRMDKAVISIVEDDASVREAMGNLMKAIGYQIRRGISRFFRNGRDGMLDS